MSANMHSYRRRKKRPNYGIRTVEVARGHNGFGFTISGQQPCILSCIVTNSPADNAGLRAGDFLISVNGLSVSKLPHDSVVQLIGSTSGLIKMAIAENYYSDSSDEEILGFKGGLHHRTRPKQLHKIRMHRVPRHINQKNDISPGTGNLRTSIVKAIKEESNCINNGSDLSNVSAMVCRESLNSFRDLHDVHSKAISKEKKVDINLSHQNLEIPVLEYNAFVGYLGTIEMPKQIPANTKLQTLRSCIKRLRQEKRTPTSVLMTIRPSNLTLKSENNTILAEYPAKRLSYVSSSSENDQRFFGLVTSSFYADGVVCEIDPRNIRTPMENEECSIMPNTILNISNSCHVFTIDTKLIDHKTHLEKAMSFNIVCTKDLISNTCLEFPNNCDYVVNTIQSIYNLNMESENNPKDISKNKAGTPGFVRSDCNSRSGLGRNGQYVHEELPQIGNDLNANSPQPSNHSEITTSSNSDSGIGFHNDCTNISDRILVVDFPIPLENVAQRNHVTNNRPQGINGDMALKSEQNAHSVDLISDNDVNNYITVPSNSCTIDANLNSTKMNDMKYKLNVRAMPDTKKSMVYSMYADSESMYETVYSPHCSRFPYPGSIERVDYVISERPVDVNYDFENFGGQNKRYNTSLLKSQSCHNVDSLAENTIRLSMDSLSMYSSKSHEPFTPKCKKTRKNQSSIDDVSIFNPHNKKKSEVEFLDPNNVKSCKSYKKKKPSTFKKVVDKELSSRNSKDLLLNYKLSPQVFGLTRPSISCESLNLIKKNLNRRSGAICDEWNSIWRPNGQKVLSRMTPLEGTLSEPDLRFAKGRSIYVKAFPFRYSPANIL